MTVSTADVAPVASAVRRDGSSRNAFGFVWPLTRLLATTVTVFLLASIITFALGEISPSNPGASILGEAATPEEIDAKNHELGLDRPVVVRYVTWLGDALQGEFGNSWFTTIPVADSIRQALPVTLSIALLALVLAVLIGGTAGIVAAMRSGGLFDRTVTVICSILGTLPPFVIGVGLIIVFAVTLERLPAGGYIPFSEDFVQWLRFAILPALALALEVAANIARQLRTSLVGELLENYAVGAEMRGYSRKRVLLGHVLRNAVSPTLAVIGLAIPLIMGGAVMTEVIFGIPGMARLALQGALAEDVPVVLGTLMVTTVVVLLGSLVINGLQILLNPAARRGKDAVAGGR